MKIPIFNLLFMRIIVSMFFVMVTTNSSQAQVPQEETIVDFQPGDEVVVNTNKDEDDEPTWKGPREIEVRIRLQHSKRYRYKIGDRWYKDRELAVITGNQEEAALEIGQKVYFYSDYTRSFRGPYEISEIANGIYPNEFYPSVAQPQRRFIYQITISESENKNRWFPLNSLATVE